MKNKSYYNNTLLLLTELSIFISLIAGVLLNYRLSVYEALALLLMNVMIFFSIYCGLKCYRTAFYERVTFTPNSENIRKMGPKPLKEELHDFYMKLKNILIDR